MKTPNDIKSWVDMLLSRRPNVEDRNYLEAIKFYMNKVNNEERPIGNWNPYRCDMYTCSECGKVYTELFDTHRCLANFGPNCGAEMIGGRE